MGGDYSFEFISIVHWVPQFIGHNKIFLGSVVSFFQVFVTKDFCDDVRPFTCAQSVLKDRLCIQYSPVIVVLLRYCLYLLLLSCFFRLFVTNVFKDWFIKNRTKPSSNTLLSSSKVRTFWEAHNNLRNLSHALYIPCGPSMLSRRKSSGDPPRRVSGFFG